MKKAKLLFAFILLLEVAAAQQVQQQEAVPTDTIAAIPITEVTGRADADYLTLNEVRATLVPLAEIVAIEEQLPVFIDSLETMRADSLYTRLNQLSARRLQSIGQEWGLYQRKLDGWKTALSKRSTILEHEDRNLQEMAKIWKATSESTGAEDTPEAILNRVGSILIRIDTTHANLKKRLATLLVYQDQISQQQIGIAELISDITKAEAQLRGQYFVRDSPPIWKAVDAKTDSVQLATQFKETWEGLLRSNLTFIRSNEDRFHLHLGIFLLLCALMIYFHVQNRRNHLLDEQDESLKASVYFVSRPIAAALLIALFLSVWIYPTPTAAVGQFILFLLIIPVLRLVPGIFEPEVHKPVYLLAGLFVLNIVHKYAIGFVVLQRVVLLAITILAIATLTWLIRPTSGIRKTRLRLWPRFLLKISPLVSLLLGIALIGNIIGSVSLASLLGIGIIDSAQVLVVAYAAALVLGGLVRLLIRRRRARAMQFIKTYAQRLETHAVAVVHVIAFFVWFRATLKVFGVYKPLTEWFASVLGHQWHLGTVTISVQNLFDFSMVLALTIVVARALRIFMDMEIFPRLRLPRGIPGAISMVVRYTVVGVGILLSISALGVDLGKFGIMAGALGVGLGFGLQNVIANFVSGLILAFERPIQVGDTVEVGPIFGDVKQIGVRSSTVKTYDGSEVIVPNADLISNQVTNWTLSDRRRRMKLPVQVAITNKPEEVLEILHKIASEHPGVLNDPEPVATFNGFGENYLDFTLYYWITENIFQYKTEVALGVFNSIKAAGINTPRPQRDLNVRLLDSSEVKEISEKEFPGVPIVRHNSKQGNEA